MQDQKDESNKIKEAERKFDKISEIIENLYIEIHQLPNSLTNLCLALLGFHVAMLFQLKLNEINIVSTFSITPLFLLAGSTLIGFYLKYRSFINKQYRKLIELKRGKKKVFKLLKKDEHIEQVEKEILSLENKFYKLPDKWYGIQSGLFLLSLILISIYVIRVLFF
ncbi:hypothetical protein ACG2F4_07350 [Halalkalibaculum sp. DA3122]|uniref:hypothetical protein n=1 Tax=Halalkalibaculum sp. DA3122 TaxID=3373607 RepID=UPI00375464C4